MNLFKDIKTYYPDDGIQTEVYMHNAYESNGPELISLKSDTLISITITK